MTISIATAPCSWGVDDPKNPILPPWQSVLKEAALAGYKSLELGPWGYLPVQPDALKAALAEFQLSIVAGTLFDDLVSEENFPAMIALTHKICHNLSFLSEQGKPTPYLVIIDFGDPERAATAGQSEKAPRLNDSDWQTMMRHITVLSEIAWKEYGVRPVIHPHAGGCIEFADELERLVRDIPHSVAGLCLDTGHLYYAGMDPVAALERYWDRIDYLHFKDVNEVIWRQAIKQGWIFSPPVPRASCAHLAAALSTIPMSTHFCASAIIRAGSLLNRKGIHVMRTPACVTSQQVCTICTQSVFKEKGHD